MTSFPSPWPALLGLALTVGCSSHARRPPEATAPVAAGAKLSVVPAAPVHGFHFPYVLRVPAVRDGAPTFLLVEGNNTGKVSDDPEVHLQAALQTARRASVGAFVAERLGLAFLVPVFPRPASEPLLYTHALDRDTLMVGTGPLARVDLQLVAMIAHARRELARQGFALREQVLLNGFSASAKFANRFTMLHPTVVRACAAGGVNGFLTLPSPSADGVALPYPVGVSDLPTLGGAPFDRTAWLRVPQFAYMGALDDNDAVAKDDAYSDDERRLIHRVLGARMQPDRWQAVQAHYRAAGAAVTFRTYPGIGHGTNGVINREVTEFFRQMIGREGPTPGR